MVVRQFNIAISANEVGLSNSNYQGSGTGLSNNHSSLAAICPGQSNLRLSAAHGVSLIAVVTIEAVKSRETDK
jgi:hypothetical protein